MRQQSIVIAIAAAILSLLLLAFTFYQPTVRSLLGAPESPHQRHKNKDPSKEHLAYATFLSTRIANESEPDAYFTAARVLNYQLRLKPETRTRRTEDIPFLVLVTPHVSQNKRKILHAEGATVVPVDLLEPEENWFTPGETRFVDQFTKLRLFELTEYDRILYLDGDMLLTRSLDGIWDEPMATKIHPTKESSVDGAQPPEAAPLPANYSIVGVSDTGGADHPFPPNEGSMLNGGFFMLRPSVESFDYYASLMSIPNLFDSGLMEQSLLNYAHRLDGPMPWHHFPPGRWNVNWPRERDLEGGAATLHDKFWEAGNKDWIERSLVERWWRVQEQMEGYWQVQREEGRYKYFDG